MEDNRAQPNHGTAQWTLQVPTYLVRKLWNWRRFLMNCQLPFENLHIWHRLRMQSKSYHNQQVVLPAQTVNALPSQGDWKFGRFDTVLVNTDPKKIWPGSGLDGASDQWFL